jgi:DNA uptake protein ComE-like DNA-binding protein
VSAGKRAERIAAPSPGEPESAPAPAADAISAQTAKQLEARLTQLERWQRSHADQSDELVVSLDRHEEQFARETNALREILKGLEERISSLEGRLADASTAEPSVSSSTPSGSDPESINDVSFEDLRHRGLSVNLAARLIAFRDSRGGLSSFDELDQVRGLSREQRDELRKTLSL